MKTGSNVNPETEHATRAYTPIRRLVFLVVLAIGLTLAWVGWLVVVPWLIVVTPRWLVRGASIGFFQALLMLYILAMPSFAVGSVISLLVVFRSLRPGNRSRRARAGRWALLCISGLLGLGLMEAGSAITLRRRSRLADLPSQFVNGTSRTAKHDWSVTVPPATPLPEAAAKPTSDREISIVVVGESSAGESRTIPGSRSGRSWPGSFSAFFPRPGSMSKSWPREGFVSNSRCCCSTT